MSGADDGKAERGDVLKRALVELRELRGRLHAVEAQRNAPIAIVGIGCRLPGGVDSPAALWRLLRDGVDATGEVPATRWDAAAYYDPTPDRPGKSYTMRGGFLDAVDGFDERFFNVSAREAAVMDPQQRLWLEVAWEALEDAALAPDRLARSRAGVFVGLSGSDYAHLMTAQTSIDAIDGYAGLGTAPAFTPGRLAYLLGLQGPALALDSACSSSLVAVHLACQSLRSGDSDLALAGGVNLMLSPRSHVALSRARVLARDGRCKTFDAAADGYARAEGCGVVVLKRLDEAQAAGDRVLAVIRGSAVNQDGPSSGLTVPNGAAQQAVIREAVARAGVGPAEIGYVEAHGTGTQLGDPIELRAIAAALGEGRDAGRALVVGSIKTNLGHLESAAGITGLIKAALMVHHGVIPAHLNVTTPTPHVDWARLGLTLPLTTAPWPATARRLAGVSSFGASGTNAHVIVEAPPPSPAASAAAASATAASLPLLPLSARSEPALRALAGRWAERLRADPTVAVADVCRTAAVGRAHFAERAAVVGADVATLTARLDALAAGTSGAGVVRGRLDRSDAPRVAFLFTGQGSQHAGMGRGLFASQPVFRRALEECDALLRPHLPRPLLALLFDGDDGALDETAVTQPALFALAWSLTALWRSWGVEPAALLGHSVGEYVAACVAGVMPLADALPLVALRGRLMQELPRDGAMVALFTDEARVQAALRAHGGPVAIAAVNGPSETIVSGLRGAVDELVATLAAAGVRSRALKVSHAFHSPLIEPMLAPFERALAALSLQPPTRLLASNLTGGLVRDELTQPRYFRDAVRAPVRFADGLKTLAAQGLSLFVEIGPAPVLSAMGRRVLPEGADFVPSLRPGRADDEQLAEAAATLYSRGVRLDWDALCPSGRRLRLPTYPFERRRHWFAAAAPAARAPAPAGQGDPLALERLRSPALVGDAFAITLDAAHVPLVRDHRVYDRIVVSGVVHLSLVAAALAEASGHGGGVAFADVEFLQPLIVPEVGTRRLQALLAPDAGGWRPFQLVSLDDDGAAVVHTRGRLRPLGDGDARPAPLDPAALRAPLADAGDGTSFYDRLWRAGEHELGPSYRTIEHLWRRDGEALARVRLPAALAGAPPQLGAVAMGEVYGQALMPAVPDYERLAADREHTFIGQAVDSSREFDRFVVGAAWCHARLRRQDGDTLIGDVTLLDEQGAVLAAVEGLRVRRVSRALVRSAVELGGRRGARAQLDVAGWRAGGAASLRAHLVRYLVERLAAVTGVAGDGFGEADRLRALGLDSLMAVDLRDRVQAELGPTLPLTALAEDPSIAELAERLASTLSPPADESAMAAATANAATASAAAANGATANAATASTATANAATASTTTANATTANATAANTAAATVAATAGRDGDDDRERWLIPLTAAASGRRRLFALPHGGGGASAFHPWRALLPADVEAYALQLPGRESRLHEPCLTSLAAIVAGAVDAMAPLLDRPFVLFGASMGGLCAFEVARALRRRGLPLPEQLVVAAYPAPRQRNPILDQAGLVRAALAQGDRPAGLLLRDLGMLPAALLDEPVALTLALRTLRADLEAVLGHVHRDEPPLSCGLLALGGRGDADVTRAALAGWAQEVDGPFALEQLDGPHLFYRTHAAATLARLLD